MMFISFILDLIIYVTIFSFFFTTGLNNPSVGSPSRLLSARSGPCYVYSTIQNKRGYRVIISSPYLQPTHQVASSSSAYSNPNPRALSLGGQTSTKGRRFPRQKKKNERETSGAHKAPSRYSICFKKENTRYLSMTAISPAREKNSWP